MGSPNSPHVQCQFLEMLSIVIGVQLEQFRKPPIEVSEYPDAMTFYYNRTVLERWHTQLDDATEDLETRGGPLWVSLEPQPASSSAADQIDSDTRQLMRDYRKLSRKVQYHVLKCDQGLDVVKDHEATNEARRANEQTDSPSTLTQMTIVVTTFYVLFAFATSVFGMNFRQFGQGKLSIWWWGAFSGPTVLVSLLLLTWISPGMQAVAWDVKLGVSEILDHLIRKEANSSAVSNQWLGEMSVLFDPQCDSQRDQNVTSWSQSSRNTSP
jgi:hypothetical protein